MSRAVTTAERKRDTWRMKEKRQKEFKWSGVVEDLNYNDRESAMAQYLSLTQRDCPQCRGHVSDKVQALRDR